MILNLLNLYTLILALFGKVNTMVRGLIFPTRIFMF